MILVLTDSDLSSTGRRMELVELRVEHLKIKQRLVAEAQAVLVIRGSQYLVLKDRTATNGEVYGLERLVDHIKEVTVHG